MVRKSAVQIRESWSFTLLLLAIYPAIFHFWQICVSHEQVMYSGGMVAGLLAFSLFYLRNHFFSPTDLAIHALVVLDILLEAVLIYPHDHLGFYWCLLAFAGVIVPYRMWLTWQNISKARPNCRTSEKSLDS